MSFSAKVKEEIGKHIGSARHCQIAELLALCLATGEVELSEQGVTFILRPENELISDKICQLLTLLFEDEIKWKRETKYIESIVQACRKLGENICLDSARKNYGEYLQFLEIEEWEATGKCVVCSTRTRFKNIKTNNYVCSDGCRYVDNENIRCI